jgi:predicted aldo/keto reductase-like oxidoreductase
MRKTSNGELISALGFGAIRLPLIDGEIDKTKATEMIYYAIDHGVNFIDTALLYHEGCSESFIGEIFTDEYRDKSNSVLKYQLGVLKKLWMSRSISNHNYINLRRIVLIII